MIRSNDFWILLFSFSGQNPINVVEFYKILFQQVIPNDLEIFLRQFVNNVLPNFSKMCCYSGTGLNTGLSAKSGFLYDSKNVKAIINSG